jgi:hypothetical protein
MNVKICKKTMKAIVSSKDTILKEKDLTVEEYGELMRELAGDDVDMLRKVSKQFRMKSVTFKGVKK